MRESVTLNLHAVLPSSRVNGPGKRFVVFFQGCARACPGCFNTATHPFEERIVCSPAGVLDGCPADAQGITVSGGEPFMQPDGLSRLLFCAKERGLTTVVYTGFTIEEIEADERKRASLEFTDALVDGPYVREKRERTLLARGSGNQRVHLLTRRYNMADFMMPGKMELVIGADGTVTGTGFSSMPVPLSVL